MGRIQLIDTTIRDGNQSLWGATGIRNAMAIQAASLINDVGFYALDYVTSTALGVAVRYHKENPWDRIRLFHAAAPDLKLGFLASPLRFISWEKVSDSVMQLAFEQLVKNGVSRFQVIDPMNDMDGLLGVAKLAKAAGAQEIVAGFTYTHSPFHNDAFYADCAKKIANSELIDRFYLKDPGGLLAPEKTGSLVTAVRHELGSRPLELHSHCSLGLAPLAYLEAAKAGIDALHVAVGPLGSGTSQPRTETMVTNLRALGFEVDIDDAALSAMSRYFYDLAEAEGLPVGQAIDFDAFALEHQVPGGMLSTMTRQLTEINQQHRLPEVLEEVARVRRELGYPIMVTPFSQVVGAQAVMNVLSGGRYENVPDEVIRFALGKFGAPAFPIDENIKDRILSRSRARELDKEPQMPEVPELRKKFGNIPDEELVLRAVMPGQLVDEALASGPTQTTYNPASRPLLKLIEELSKRDDLSRVAFEKEDFKIELTRSQPN